MTRRSIIDGTTTDVGTVIRLRGRRPLGGHVRAAVATALLAAGLVTGGPTAGAAIAHKVSGEFGYDTGGRGDRHPRFVADVTGDGRAGTDFSTPYSVTAFFIALDPHFVGAEESMTLVEKTKIVDSKFSANDSVCSDDSVGEEETHERWYVSEQNSDLLELHTCGGSSVIIRIYRRDTGGFVGVVVSVLGHHSQSQNFRFFDISGDGKIRRELATEELLLEKVTENEFLAKEDFFVESDNHTVPFLMEDDGAISAAPWTWMEPRWEAKEIVRRIKYVWNGKEFRKEVKSKE